MPPKPAAKAKAAATDDELGDLFEGIGDDNAVSKPAAKSKASKAKADLDDADILAELEDQLGEAPTSRPQTPRSKDTTAKRAPPNTDDKPAPTTRKSGEGTRDFHSSMTPSTSTSSDVHGADKKPAAAPAPAPAPAPAAGGSWWGGIIASATATASAAMKQAEEAARQLQQSEEAKKWASQVQSNVGAIRGFVGEEIRHRALPTFSDILHTLAPPIASHERLSIHITHDLVGYPSLDPLVYSVFSRVMAQVEGGDLMVIQRGKENIVRPRSASQLFSSGSDPSSYGWRDGPWWRAVDSPRDLGTIRGLAEGTKLCRASAEAYASEYFAAHGGLELARQRAVEPVSEDNPVRSSDLFLALQAVTVDGDGKDGLFDAPPTAAGTDKAGQEGEKKAAGSDEEEDPRDKELVVFAVYVLDPVHDISYHTVSQSIPVQWVRWLDASAPLTPTSSGGDDTGAAGGYEGGGYGVERVPEEIRDVVESGGVDPREWVAEWLEELLNLSVGVVAQRYVARRMGVGLGGLGKGKRKMEVVVQEGGGEAARAGLI